MTTNILDYWVFPYEPRQNQVTALNWLAEQDSKYILMEIPVGGGKSNIGVTYSRYLASKGDKRGNSFILTPQRILQEQYERSFREYKEVRMASLYGKTNYECKSKKATCEVGSLIKPRCPQCPHAQAKDLAKKANDTVLNYRLALTSFAFTETFESRKLMVMDECHTLEDHLVDFDAIQIAEWRCKKLNMKFVMQKTLSGALQWMKDYYLPKLKDVVTDMEYDCEPLFDKTGTELTKTEVRKLRELAKLQTHLDESTLISLYTSEYLNDNFVLVWDKISFQFKRLTGAYSFHKHIEPNAEKFLFMSSTILDKDGFCEDLGIPADQTAFISLESEFDKDIRPVYYMPQMKMNAKWVEPENASGRKKMLDSIFKLLEMHKNDSGIIHTANFKIAEWLEIELSGNIDHIIYHHNPDSDYDRNSVIQEFQSNPNPSVLISPSSTEGLDLKYEKGRFAIFAKVPFGYLGDQWIKRRMEMSTRWYQRRALIDVIQGGGRVVRAEDDWGNVYILDGSWNFLYNQAYHMIPRWWREGYSKL